MVLDLSKAFDTVNPREKNVTETRFSDIYRCLHLEMCLSNCISVGLSYRTTRAECSDEHDRIL